MAVLGHTNSWSQNKFILQLTLLNHQAIILPELDSAIIGVEENTTHHWVLTYSIPKMIEELQAQGLTEPEAIDFVDYNILQIFSGDNSPLFRCSRDYTVIPWYDQMLDDESPLLTATCDVICLELTDHSLCSCSCHIRSYS